MAKFYKQPEGLLIPPPGFDKWHVAWTLDNVLCGFRKFLEDNNRWPTVYEIDIVPYLPSIRTLQRSFGGIKNVRKNLGMADEDIDLTKGKYRSQAVAGILNRGWGFEKQVYEYLVQIFLEPYVHNQSRIYLNENKFLVLDFLVFHQHGKFAVDVFYPNNRRQNFSSNINAKYRVYKDFPLMVYLVVGNPEITEEEIRQNTERAIKPRNSKATLLSYRAFQKGVGSMDSLVNPYTS